MGSESSPIRVLSGAATDEELAALTVVLLNCLRPPTGSDPTPARTAWRRAGTPTHLPASWRT
jgi:hypothetical protein